MNIFQETQQLRDQLSQWASSPEWWMLVRYELLPDKTPANWYQRMVQRIRRLLRIMGLDCSRYRNQVWHVGLKHAPMPLEARPLLLWSEGLEQHNIRNACAGIHIFLQANQKFSPVLVTDLADFAFYSRLQWLVEYVPFLGDDASYYDQKRRYLAWRYRDALALPLAAGLLEQKDIAELMGNE